jgi:cellulase/cellobiase CelA1
MVVQRRTTLLAATQESVTAAAQKLDERLADIREKQEQQRLKSVTARVAGWIQTVYAFKALQFLYVIVDAARKLKAQNPVRQVSI